MENCSMDGQLPLANYNAIEDSESTTPAVAVSAIEMQDNNNNDVLCCVKCGGTCGCEWWLVRGAGVETRLRREDAYTFFTSLFE